MRPWKNGSIRSTSRQAARSRRTMRQESEALFEGLAKSSARSIEPEYRDRLIAGKLFGDLDSDMAILQKVGSDQQSVRTPSRKSTQAGSRMPGTVEQVVTLLKRSAGKDRLPLRAGPSPAGYERRAVSAGTRRARSASIEEESRRAWKLWRSVTECRYGIGHHRGGRPDAGRLIRSGERPVCKTSSEETALAFFRCRASA